MTASSQPAFPSAAIQWLTPTVHEPRLLVLGRSGAPLMTALAAVTGRLVACDTSRGGLRTLLARAPGALPAVAHAEHYLQQGPVLVEEFLDGQEVSLFFFAVSLSLFSCCTVPSTIIFFSSHSAWNGDPFLDLYLCLPLY